MTSSRNSIKIWSCIQSCLNKIAGLTLNFCSEIVSITDFRHGIFFSGCLLLYLKKHPPKKSDLERIICDSSHDLVPFAQFKKRKKHPWRSSTFSKVTKISTPVWVFSHFLDCTNGTKLHKASHIMYALVWKRQIL